MTWVAVAVVGGALINAGVSAYTNKKDQKAADKAQDKEIAFAEEQQSDWEAVFGDTEQKLSDFYSNYTPDLIEAQGLEAFNTERDQVVNKLQTRLKQRGLGTSGITAQVDTNFAIETAKTRAQIRANAPMQAAKEQLGFLSVGMGNDPASNTQNAYGAASARTGAQANLSSRQTEQAFGQATNTGFNYLIDTLEKRAAKNSANTNANTTPTTNNSSLPIQHET